MKKDDGKKFAGSIQAIRKLFEELPIEDKVKVIDSLVDPIKYQVNKVIRDTYDSNFSGCSEFFIEDSYVYYNSPTDNKQDRFMTACSYDQDNISFPLRWLSKGYDYKAEYGKICEDKETCDRRYKECEEKELLRKLKAKYEQ